jgi:glycosyltransferase involved in cell wall biosynthesis
VTRSPIVTPAMPSRDQPTWPDARWIGMLDLDGLTPDPDGTTEFVAAQSDAFRVARVLLRRGLEPVTVVESTIEDGRVRVPVPAAAPPSEPPQSIATPPVSVVLCTRDRPEQLADALESVLALDYPEFEVVVVDNAARTDATRLVVGRLADPRLRLVVEPVPGLSTARNAGLRAAAHDVVAYTDDDVVVDRYWLRGIARGFARAAQVSCVSGLVPSGELRTAAQAYFDQRVSWSASLEPRVFRLADPPRDQPLFPFQPGRFGTGANFAVRRTRILEIGGFDEALGAGTAAQGGEDLDLFFRVLTEGDTLVTEPSAIVWHRHRSDNDALLSQARGYGLGLGAWLTKVGLNRSHRKLAIRVVRRRLGSSLRVGLDYGAVMASPAEFRDQVPTSVGRTEVLAVLGGPRALWRGRRQVARNRAPAVGT